MPVVTGTLGAGVFLTRLVVLGTFDCVAFVVFSLTLLLPFMASVTSLVSKSAASLFTVETISLYSPLASLFLGRETKNPFGFLSVFITENLVFNIPLVTYPPPRSVSLDPAFGGNHRDTGDRNRYGTENQRPHKPCNRAGRSGL